MISPRRVSLHLDLRMEFGRQLMVGAAKFAREATDWQLINLDHEALLREARAPYPQLHGVVGHLMNRRRDLYKALSRRAVPMVNTSNRYEPGGIPSVINDDIEIGRMGAEHLLDRGVKRFCFVGINEFRYMQERSVGFRERLCQAGIPENAVSDYDDSGSEQDLVKFIQALTPPLGVMVGNDERASRFARACCDQGISIPEDIAVLGVDNDPAITELAHTPLSSVIPAFEDVGYQSARLLWNLTNGAAPPKVPIRIRPRGVLMRRSTDFMAIEDRLVAQALSIIRDQACNGLSVPCLVAELPSSRRSLELRFKSAVGRTIHQQIRLVKLQRAREMLRNGSRSILEIALTVGINDPNRFTSQFRDEFGQTPSAYRSLLSEDNGES